MNKQYSATASDMFKEAHKMTKATIKRGDSYNVNFGQCLVIVKAKYMITEKPATKRIQWGNVAMFAIGVVLTVALALTTMGVGSILTLIFGYLSYTAQDISIVASVLLGGLSVVYTVLIIWLVVHGASEHIKEEFNQYTFKGI